MESKKLEETIEKDPLAEAESVTPIQVAEDEDEKIFMTLESMHYPEEKEIEKNEVIKKSALEKLDKLLQNKTLTKKNIKSENSNSNDSSTNDSKGPPRILNESLGKVVEKKRLLNNAGKPISTEEDLIAILEGDNHNEDEDSLGVEIRGEKDKETVTTVVLSKNEKMQIAAKQMKEMAGKKRKEKERKTPVPTERKTPVPTTSELITSIAMEWSDNEKDGAEEKSDKNPKPKILNKNARNAKAKTVLSENDADEKDESIENKEEESPVGIAPFRRSRVIKKKIIWDPDAPETSFSYASLIKPKPQPKSMAQKAATVQAKKKIIVKKEASPKPAVKKVIAEKAKPAPPPPPPQVNNRKRKESSSEADKKIEEKKPVPEVKDAKNKNEKSTNSSGEITKPPPQVIKKPRVTKGKLNSASWDFVNKQRNEEMMIIRRRSSSYSSTNSQRRLSLETSPNKSAQKLKDVQLLNKKQPQIKMTRKVVDAVIESSPPKKRKQEDENIEKRSSNQTSAKQIIVKKMPTELMKKVQSPTGSPSITVIKRGVMVKSNDLAKQLNSNTNTVVVKKQEEKLKSDVEIFLKRYDSAVNFIYNIKGSRSETVFSIDFIRKFVSTLEHLKNDNLCKVVVVSSKNLNFCQGIDCKVFCTVNKERNIKVATEYAKYIKMFFETLINFNKPIIAAVNGVVSNLGVMMLPLFDFVYASDKCAFETSYAKIGQLPEGNSIMSNFHIEAKYKLKLLYLAERISATEALSSGLITAVYPGQTFEKESINIATKIAALSQQTFKSMKQMRIRKFSSDGLIKALDEEENILIEQWNSTECQTKLKEIYKD